MGFAEGSYDNIEEEPIIWVVDSKQKGFLKQLLCELHEKFQCDTAVFSNVISPTLIDKLKHILNIWTEDVKGNKMLCVRVRIAGCEKNE